MSIVTKWFWDAYLDWDSALLGNAGVDQLLASEKYSPVFVRLRTGVTAPDPTELVGFDAFIEALTALKPHISLKVEMHEIDLISANAEQSAEGYIYVKTNDLQQLEKREQLERYFYILDVGASVVLADDIVSIENDEVWPSAQTPNEQLPNAPIVAAIDDGIGFLNKSFRNHNKTRFLGFWMQAREKIANELSEVRLGRVLVESEIDAILGKGAMLDEPFEYKALNQELLADGAHKSTEYSFSHGTHVLDLAGGADSDALSKRDYAEVANWPLLAVQLPPTSVADTSGSRHETYIMMGVRWILSQARVAYSKQHPVLINISFGLMAGPKNGTKFLEYQIARELVNFPNAEVVYAYGNSYQRNLVSVFEGLSTTARGVDLQLQPDDFAPSFVEIMANGQDELPSDLKIRVTGPAGLDSGFARIPENSYLPLGDGARLYHVGKRMVDPNAASPIHRPAHYVLATAPTASHEMSAALASAGTWRIELLREKAEPIDISLQVQRGDTAPGYTARGKQAYFDHENAYDWDLESLGYNAPSADGPITRAGTNSAMTTVHGSFEDSVAARIHSVGGARRTSAGYAPAAYSAEGASWSGNSPTESAVSEDGIANGGILASGTYSGTVQQLHGTSSAAPRVTRKLAHAAARGLKGLPPENTDYKNTNNITRLSDFVSTDQGRSRRSSRP